MRLTCLELSLRVGDEVLLELVGARAERGFENVDTFHVDVEALGGGGGSATETRGIFFWRMLFRASDFSPSITARERSERAD